MTYLHVKRYQKCSNLVSLFTHIRIKNKHIKFIKSKCGIIFQSIEERTKNETLDDEDIQSDPIWDDDNEFDDETKRLCLNCMMMYSV